MIKKCFVLLRDKWTHVLNFLLTAVLVIATVAMAYYNSALTKLADNTDKTTTKQVEVLDEVKKTLHESGKILREEADNSTKTTAKQIELLNNVAKILQDSQKVLSDSADNTLKTTNQQIELFNDVNKMLHEEEDNIARDSFVAALAEASVFCPTCPSCSSAYLISAPLDKALRYEPKAEKLLSSSNYIELAYLGSSIWEYEMTVKYAQKALDKSVTPLDRFYSHLILGHVNYLYCKDDSEHERMEAAKKHFKEAMASLQMNVGSAYLQYHCGLGYQIWAEHEAFLKHDDESDTWKKRAMLEWDKLPGKAIFISNMEDEIKLAKDGIRPQVSCLFKTVEPPIPVRIEPTPAPTPAPAPAPAPAQTPTQRPVRFTR